MTADEPELKAQMLASRCGDAIAYHALLANLAPRLRSYYERELIRLGHSTDQVEDLVQETLLAIHQKRQTYDCIALFTPWLQAIARYRLISFLRSRGAQAIETSIDNGERPAANHDCLRIEAKVSIKVHRSLTILAPLFGRGRRG